MNVKEKILFFSLSAIILGGLVFWLGAVYFSQTKVVPTEGGTYTEGVVGQPAYINPLLSQTSEADADLSELLYSSLFKYDTAGRLQKRLVTEYQIADEGKRYIVKLREGTKWHDGKNLTAGDALFTFTILQDPAYKSPLRQNWQGVEIIQKDDYTLEFILKKPYFGFLDNLTVGILPKHVWENIAPEKFALADYNLSPIGSGPYQYADFKKDSNGNILSYALRSFPGYFERPPYIGKIIFHFYPDEEALIDAYNRREVMGVSNVIPEKVSTVQDRKSAMLYSLRQPRLFGVFFNDRKSVALAEAKVRQALGLATNREEIIQHVFQGYAIPAFSPFLPEMQGYADASLPFDPERAKGLLDEAGWKVSEEGVRRKADQTLSFAVVTPDWPELIRTADLLKAQWEAAGARVEVRVMGVSDLQQNAIRPREYQALLFGEAASFNPDPYSFWHSSQKNDPGLNLAFFEDKAADTLLSDAREILDDNTRAEKYRSFQQIFTDKMPAVFFYSPNYLYVVNRSVRGVGARYINAPQYRFTDITDWYLKTKRVRK